MSLTMVRVLAAAGIGLAVLAFAVITATPVLPPLLAASLAVVGLAVGLLASWSVRRKAEVYTIAPVLPILCVVLNVCALGSALFAILLEKTAF